MKLSTRSGSGVRIDVLLAVLLLRLNLLEALEVWLAILRTALRMPDDCVTEHLDIIADLDLHLIASAYQEQGLASAGPLKLAVVIPCVGYERSSNLGHYLRIDRIIKFDCVTIDHEARFRIDRHDFTPNFVYRCEYCGNRTCTLRKEKQQQQEIGKAIERMIMVVVMGIAMRSSRI